MHSFSSSNPKEFDNPQFLEPAHRHDPARVSHIADLPAAVLEALPPEAQASLSAIQESTSIAFASHTRLQDLVREKFTRLVPAKDQEHDADLIVKYSEPAWFNYVNHLQAEKEYLLLEAFSDWRHKAMRVAFCGNHDLCFTLPCTANNTSPSSPTTLLKWWAALQSTVEGWMDEAEDVEIPSFAETVAEYQAFQAKEIRRREAREERNRRRKTMLDLERPDSGLALCKLNSGGSV